MRPTNTAGLQVTINLTPEMVRTINGGSELRFRVELGQPQLVQPSVHQPVHPPVHRPVHRTPVADRYDAPRTGAVRDRTPARAFGTIQQHFYSLMQSGVMLQQTDWRLAQRGLLIPQGGLCATTSAVNVLHAAFSHLGRDTRMFTSTSDDLVARLVSDAWRLNKDARMGLDFSSLSLVINEVANRLHPEVGVKAERPYFWRTRDSIDFKELAGDDDTLSLLCVTTGSSAHAITFLGIDRYRGVLTYSDPNYPNQALEAPFSISGNKLFLHSFSPGELTDVLKIRTKNFDDTGSIRWADYAGKRVHITGNDGRKFLTTIDRVDSPSAEYPSGRVVQYNYIFGSGGGGTWPIEDIRRIEEVRAPSEAQIEALQKYVGKRVRFKFSDPGWQSAQGDKVFEVESLTRESKPSHSMFGGLAVRPVKDSFARTDVVPFEVIDSVEVVKKTRTLV